MGQFYCYRHVRNDSNTPFYIGIGKKQRENGILESEYKRAFDFTLRSNFWLNISRKSNGITVDILFECDSHEEVKAKEAEFIKIYGRHDNGSGILCNMTDGGDGATGVIRSEETRKKMSINGIGRKRTEEQNKKLSDSLRNSEKARQSILKLSQYNIGRPKSDETKVKIGLKNKGKKRTDEQRLKIKHARAVQKMPPCSQEKKDKLRISNSKKKSTPKQLAQISRMSVAVGQYDLNGALISKFVGMQDAARKTGASATRICACAKGKRKTHFGFIWKYL